MLYYKVDVLGKDVSVGEKKKVAIVVLPAKNFNGEHNKRSHPYIIILWLVSFWAMITNLSQAIYRKMRTGHSLRRILWEMGRSSDHFSSIFVDRFSEFNHQSKTGAANWRSLDIFYNYHKKIKPKLSGFDGWITRHWIEKMENRQAVANRLKIVVNLLEDAFKKFINEPEIRLVSIASGSAQAVIEAIERCPNLNIKAVLIDLDESAIEASRQRVKEAGLEERFSFIHGTTKVLEGVCQKFRPHIVEMVGFLDYRPDSKAIKLVSRIRDCLLPGGVFLTCNINKNREKIFLDWVLLWPMIYRNPKRFAGLLAKGGFSPEEMIIFYEPFRIHGVAVCKK